MRRLFLCDCQPGDVVEDVFVVSNKQLSATTTGKYFIKAFISDRSSQLTARMWNASRELFSQFPDGGFVRVRGRVENYQNNLQFIIEQVWPAKEGSFEMADLLPHTTRDIDAMCQRVFEIGQSIQNRHLSALVHAFLEDEELMNNFCHAPAAASFHHAFIGGLLEHTLNAMEVADAIVRFYPGLNRDLCLAGIFLHDIAKTWELSYQTVFGYTDGGQLVGHIVKAAMWVEDKARHAEKTLGEPIPRDLLDVVQHIILSHHGQPEFGAARVPSTPEAIFVHTIENLDAKLMMALSSCRTPDASNTEGNWTEFMKAFGGRLFRPDVAPSEAPVNDEPAGSAPTASAQPARTPPAPAAGSPAPAAQQAGAGKPVKMQITNPLFETGKKKA